MPQPSISVITVVRNDAPGLMATRESLIRQSWRDWEWLIIDGGSEDGTAALLAGWKNELAWWDSRPDGGPFAAMNRGMERARGRWLLFLNAGDLLEGPDALAALIRRGEEDDADLVYGDAVEEASPGGQAAIRPARHPRWAFYGMFAHHCAVLYRHAAVCRLRYRTDLEIASDYDFTLRALLASRHHSHVAEPVARFAPGGRSRERDGEGRKEQFLIRRDLLCMPLGVCLSIWGIQFGMAALRKLLPKFYARMRFTATVGA